MPELVDEIPGSGSGWGEGAKWKAPALKMARENPGKWVRCDGDHHPTTPGSWRRASGAGVLPDGFKARGSSAGAPEGRVFVYVRWVGENDG